MQEKCFEKMQRKKHEQRTIVRKVWLWLSLATTAILGGSSPRPFSKWAVKAGKVRIYIKSMQQQIALVMEQHLTIFLCAYLYHLKVK